MTEIEIENYKQLARDFANSLNCKTIADRDSAYCDYLKIVEKYKNCRIID